MKASRVLIFMRDATYYLVRYILKNATKHKWQRDSNHISLKMTPEMGAVTTINVFDSRYRHPDGEIVHSHQRDFTSRTIAGVYRQQRYHVTADFPGNPLQTTAEGGIRCLNRQFDRDFKPVWDAPEFVNLKPLRVEQYVAGEGYSVQAPELHRAFPEDGTVTLITRDYVHPKMGVQLCWLPGQEPRRASGDRSEVKMTGDALSDLEVEDIVGRALHEWF